MPCTCPEGWVGNNYSYGAAMLSSLSGKDDPGFQVSAFFSPHSSWLPTLDTPGCKLSPYTGKLG